MLKNHLCQISETPPTLQSMDNNRGFPSIKKNYLFLTGISYIFIYVDHNWHFYVYKLMISVGNLSILSDFWTHSLPKCSTAVSMATAMQMAERIVDYLVLGPNSQDRKASAKSMTMRGTTF